MWLWMACQEPSSPGTPIPGTSPPGSTETTSSATEPPAPPPSTSGTSTPPPAPQRVIAYYVSWAVYARQYFVTDIPADRVTHLNYAFANLQADGTCVLGDLYADTELFYPGDCWDVGCERGNFHQLALLKEQHPALRTLLSVGGWTWSGNFSAVAADAAGRSQFAASCADLVERWGFDGLDIDWEYPVFGGLTAGTAADTENFTLLLAATRAELDARPPPTDGRYLLTAAVAADPAKVDVLQVPEIFESLDWANVMAYDFHGGWELTTNHQAALAPSAGDPGDPQWNVSGTIGAWLGAGADPADLVLGVPFYGRGWSGVPATNDGLFQPATGLPTGTWEPGVFDADDLALNYVPTMTRHWSDEAAAPWLYDAATGVMISYEDQESLAAKVDFVRAQRLGGVMAWELSGDDGTLLDTVWDGVVAP